MKKTLTLLMFALFVTSQFAYAASQQKLASDEIKANINSSLNQAKEEATALNDSKGSPLIIAVKNNNVKVALELLKDPKVNVKATDSLGNTALHYAQNEQIIERLVARGANINAKNTLGETTPIMYASATNLPKIVSKMIALHANVAAKDKDGENALIYAVLSECNLEIIKILVNNGAQKDVKSHGRTLKDLLTPDEEGRPRYLDVQCDDVSAAKNIVFPKK